MIITTAPMGKIYALNTKIEEKLDKLVEMKGMKILNQIYLNQHFGTYQSKIRK